MPTNKRLHNQIYHIAFFITFFLFTIKYYYGADVINYYKFYKDIADPISIILQEPGTETPFEIGFVLFMSILKWINLSYWWMTALVSIIYFYAIYKLFNLIPSYKIVALLILVLLDYNLIFATHRQCLAVSFFILLFLSYLEKKYDDIVVTYDVTNSDDLTADELQKEKDKALKIVNDFCYPKVVADAILSAVTLTQISNVLAGARHTY
jgi:hypothetical protein